MDSDRSIRAGGLVAGGLALLLLAALSWLALSLAADPVKAAKPVTAPTATTLNAEATEDYWTLEMINEAPPLELPSGNGYEAETFDAEGPSEADLFGSEAQTFKARQIKRPRKYPHRVHGKLVGTFPGVGNYSCSATVVSSRSRSLIATAGHCVYDLNTRQFATNLFFAPGYQYNQLPYGAFPGTNVITTGQWVKRGNLDFDAAMIRLGANRLGTVQKAVGSRGIGFNQPRKQHLTAYGYPAAGNKKYDGRKLIKCDSGPVPDPVKKGGPDSRGMRCDMKQGSSGGGWVSQGMMVVSNVSHGYPQDSRNKFYGPYYGAAIKNMYKTARPGGWPTIGPLGCMGEVATIVGTNRGEKIVGTPGDDVIAAMGGNDKINGRGGNDKICGGPGNDKIKGGKGRDRIDGGDGRDSCNGGASKDRIRGCERTKKASARI